MGVFGKSAVRAGNSTGAGATRRGMLSGAVGVTALLFTTGLIGISAAAAATNKPVAGVGVRCCKRPNGALARIIPIPSDAGGRINYTATEAGDYDVDVEKPDLRRMVDALAAQEVAEATAAAATQRTVIQGPLALAPAVIATQRFAIIRFAPGLRVTAPDGQVAVTGNPGVFVLSNAAQTFIVSGVAQGGVISAQIETVDISDLVPAAEVATVTARLATRAGQREVGPLGLPAASRMVPNPGRQARRQ